MFRSPFCDMLSTGPCGRVIALLLVGAPAWLAGQSLEWSVSPGNGGLRVYGGWSYVVAHLTSKGTPVKGEIAVRSVGAIEAVYRLPFDLPEQSSRKYFHYFQSDQDLCEVTVEVGGRPVGDPESVALFSMGRRKAIVELGRATGVDAALGTGFLRGKPYARSEWESLPGRPCGYDSVEWLFVSDSDQAGELSYGQARALRAWIETGGKMMVFVRSGRKPAGVVMEMMEQVGLSVGGPTKVAEFKSLAERIPGIAEFDPVVVSRVNAPPPSRQWTEEGVVLSAVTSLGWGRIGLCGIHPQLVEKFPSHDPRFWSFIGQIDLEPKGLLSGGAGLGIGSEGPRRFVDEYGGLLVPGEPALPISMGWVVLYVIAYLSFVGPGQWWMLKKGVSFKASLGAFAVSIILFASAANAFVRVRKGDELWQKDIGFLTLSESGAARGGMFTSLFVPFRGKQRLTFGGEVLSAPVFSQAAQFATQRRVRDWGSRPGALASEAAMTFRQWDVRASTSSSWHYPARLTGISPLPRELSTRVRRAHLVTKAGVKSLGTVDLEEFAEAVGDRRLIPFKKFAGNWAGLYEPGTDHSQDDTEKILLALCVGLPRSLEELDVRPFVGPGKAVLIGFVDFPPLRPELDIASPNRVSVCLVRALVDRP